MRRRDSGNSARAPRRLAGASLVLAGATGVEWLGKPLRLVHLLTIIGLSMAAGVSWGQAVWRARRERPAASDGN
jgi:hypothetical protein